MFEAFKIGIKLSLANEVSAGLLLLTGQFGRLDQHLIGTKRHLTDLELQFARLKTMGMAGGVLAGAGLVGLAMFKGPIEEAKRMQQETAKFASLGFGDAVTQQAVKFATGMKTIGVSATENMALVSDAMAVFKDLHHAEMAAPLMAAMKFGNQAVFGKEGGSANESKFMDMLKVIEFRGGLASNSEFKTQANFVQQVISGSRNRVDASQLLQALKTGGVALSQRSNEDFYLGSEPLIQEFGGQRYGTGAMSIYQNLVQARGTKTAQAELFRLGLLDPSGVEFNKMGELKKALPGSFKGSSILEKQGELALLEKVLLPAFAAKGITGDESIIRELGMILGNRTGSSLMSRIYQQRATIHMQADANRNAQNIDQLSATGSKLLTGKELDLHAKWRDVMNVLGTTVLPIAIKGVEGLTRVLQAVVNFGREFPILTKALTITFGVLAALATAGGAILMARAAFGALSLALGGGAAAGGAGLVGALGVAGTAVGIFAGAIAALAAGFAVGSVLNKGIDALLSKVRGQETSLGSSIYDWVHAGDSGGSGRGPGGFGTNGGGAAFGSPHIRGGGGGSNRAINNTIVMPDGKVLAKVVTQEQSKELSRPNAGGRRPDGSMSAVAAGASRTGSW